MAIHLIQSNLAKFPTWPTKLRCDLALLSFLFACFYLSLWVSGFPAAWNTSLISFYLNSVYLVISSFSSAGESLSEVDIQYFSHVKHIFPTCTYFQRAASQIVWGQDGHLRIKSPSLEL